MKSSGLVATRRSLVNRLANWDDQRRWQEFFDTYWKLIYSAARKSGLTDAEAQEVVQETVITVAKKIDKRLSLLPNRDGRSEFAEALEVFLEERLETGAKLVGIQLH